MFTFSNGDALIADNHLPVHILCTSKNPSYTNGVRINKVSAVAKFLAIRNAAIDLPQRVPYLSEIPFAIISETNTVHIKTTDDFVRYVTNEKVTYVALRSEIRTYTFIRMAKKQIASANYITEEIVDMVMEVAEHTKLDYFSLDVETDRIEGDRIVNMRIGTTGIPLQHLKSKLTNPRELNGQLEIYKDGRVSFVARI